MKPNPRRFGELSGIPTISVGKRGGFGGGIGGRPAAHPIKCPSVNARPLSRFSQSVKSGVLGGRLGVTRSPMAYYGTQGLCTVRYLRILKVTYRILWTGRSSMLNSGTCIDILDSYTGCC